MSQSKHSHNNSTFSSAPFASKRKPISRRWCLRQAGVSLALPMLGAMGSVAAQADNPDGTPRTPKRMLAICNNLGLLPRHFFPTQAGRNYELSHYLNQIRRHRNDFTVMSGVSHPEVDGGHPADNCFLTAAPHPGSGGFKNTISLDQFMADHIGHQTRFPSLTLGVNVQPGVRSLSWTSSGVMIPCQQSPSQIFSQMFLQGTPEQTQKQIRKLELGQSILDVISDQADSMQVRLGNEDRERVDQYLSSVRDLEKRMASSKEWETKPKPNVNASVPLDPKDPRKYMDKVRLMYDLARLAFQTDSTRLITLMLDSVNSPAIEVNGVTVSDGYHNLSHHGQSEEKLAQLERIDLWHLKLLGNLIDELKQCQEGDESLLDRSMVLYGSNLGSAHAHTTTNLPVILAGGSFRHGQHLSFDQTRNYPLPNLFVSMIQQMEIESDTFASSTGTMRGLDLG